MAAPRAGHHGTINQSSAFKIEQSLRFNEDDSAYLNRTPGSAGNRKTWTWSGWVKYTVNNASLYNQPLFWASSVATTGISFSQNPNTAHRIYVYNAGENIETTQFFRDPSSWYHIVAVIDTTQATASNRTKLYINGVQVTDLASTAYPTQNADGDINNTVEHNIGKQIGLSRYLDAYLAEVNFIDGSALDPTDFGFTDPLTNTWRPKKYTGTYGTNGFYLDFSDSSNLGDDRSGNGNNFTASGFVAYDLVPDSPSGITLGTAGNVPQPSNYCTLNPLDVSNGGFGLRPNALSDGNLTDSSTSNALAKGTLAVNSGKWYFEYTGWTSTSFRMGVALVPSTSSPFSNTDLKLLNYNGQYQSNAPTGTAGGTTYGGSISSADIIGVAVDMDNRTIAWSKNGQYGDGSGNWGATYANASKISLESTGGVTPCCLNGSTTASAQTFNFGQQPFVYPPGSSTSDIGYFKSISYTGNGSTQSITGVGFQPDFVWIKKRDSTGNHMLTDVVRGANTELNSNTQNAQSSNTNALTSFDSDGFSVGPDGAVNINSETLQAWCWKAGGTASSNTNGSITSSVSANQTAGFSVVTWNGSTANGTVGHGLDTAPGLIIFKRTNNVTSWPVYTSILGASQVLYLNETAAKAASGNSFGSSPTDPTSTVFSVGDRGDTNYGTMVAYCFAAKTGITSIGSYEGNGLSSGLSVDVGFKPAMVLIKNADAVDDWNIIDNNKPTEVLRPNSTSAEDSSAPCHITPTGFRVTTGNSHRINYANETFVYIAFAENYTAPKEIDEYKALCTANLPTPTSPAAVRPDKYFKTVLYTGNDSTQSIDVGFAPDFVWAKNRDTAGYHHDVYDRVRGDNLRLYTSQTNAEGTGYLQFGTNGFNLTSGGGINNSGDAHVAWCWKAGGAAVSNTDGSITSQVSANQDAGFSIVTYTGQSSNFTWGHGLGVAPSMVIIKRRNTAAGWSVYHKSLGATKRLQLDQNGGQETMSYFQNTEPTSTVFSVTTNGGVGADGDTYVAYCFAEVEGYSKFGSYVGNNTSDGPFVYCGFKPRWIMVKSYTTGGSSAYSWSIIDTARSSYNIERSLLKANEATAQNTAQTADVDILSNGFKPRYSPNETNGPNTYIFAAFAETPSNNLFGGQANAR